MYRDYNKNVPLHSNYSASNKRHCTTEIHFHRILLDTENWTQATNEFAWRLWGSTPQRQRLRRTDDDCFAQDSAGNWAHRSKPVFNKSPVESCFVSSALTYLAIQLCASAASDAHRKSNWKLYATAEHNIEQANENPVIPCFGQIQLLVENI